MSYRLVFSESYQKEAKKFFKRHPELLSLYEKVLILLESNPFHPSLRLHKLQGRFKHLHSISVNMQYRITIEFLIQENQIIFIDIGSHAEVYS